MTKHIDKHPPWYNQYITVKLPPGSPYMPMANKDGYIPEHRLIIAQHLGRCLTRREIVHHIDGKKQDNRIENLELRSSNGEHTSFHRQVSKVIKELQVEARM